MSFEFFLLGTLIVIFLISFCGLLQKVRQTYETERRIIERAQINNQNAATSIVELYNPSFDCDNEGIFPNAPPPYSQLDLPPNYEDIMKDVVLTPANINSNRNNANNQTNTELNCAQNGTNVPQIRVSTISN
ncbi:uncharacterized protein LOC109595655 [Aethina tumida]|uniref:uncharacterized protein LOC109595655 n=1 Tax=Aethina tumida TaxID=116153 RepID=UPI00096B0F11|nr:uncharacterized protein LOC109595655 [Aethina tumida]